jgi:hypothetical protein
LNAWEFSLNDVELTKLAALLYDPFYESASFWIGTVLSIVGITFSVKAFQEAKAAKQAASEAGKTVKIQTITIELSEIAQRLDKLDFNISFSDARDLINEISRRLRRLIAPFQSTPEMHEICDNLKLALDQAKLALEEIRPQAPEMDIQELSTSSVYFATQGHLANISGLVAEIMGLFEKRTIEAHE